MNTTTLTNPTEMEKHLTASIESFKVKLLTATDIHLDGLIEEIDAIFNPDGMVASYCHEVISGMVIQGSMAVKLVGDEDLFKNILNLVERAILREGCRRHKKLRVALREDM